MTSAIQRIANRKNAANSTGPKTIDGKAVSRRNSLEHGLRAETLMLDGEDPDRFAALQDRLHEELAPEGILESELVEHISTLMWRARRIPQFEAALYRWMGAWCETFAARADLAKYTCPGYGELRNFHARLKHNAKEHPVAVRDQLILGRLLQYSLDRDFTGKLSRYEAHLMGQLRVATADLERAQNRRRKQAGERPMKTLNPQPDNTG